MPVNQFIHSFVGHRYRRLARITWGYHLITEIEMRGDHALVTLEHDVTSAPIYVRCPEADFPWLAPFLALYNEWTADPDCTAQPLLPVEIRDRRFVLSRAGAHHDYSETPRACPPPVCLASHPTSDLIRARRKQLAAPGYSLILTLIRKATERFG